MLYFTGSGLSLKTINGSCELVGSDVDFKTWSCASSILPDRFDTDYYVSVFLMIGACVFVSLLIQDLKCFLSYTVYLDQNDFSW